MDFIDELQSLCDQNEILRYYKILQIEDELKHIDHVNDDISNQSCICYDIDELVGVLYSHVLTLSEGHHNFFRILEISHYFNETYEMVQVLLENSSDYFTVDILYQLLELSNPDMTSIDVELTNRSIVIVDIATYLTDKGNNLKMYKDSDLIILDQLSDNVVDEEIRSTKGPLVETISLNNKRYHHIIASKYLRFGVHELTITMKNELQLTQYDVLLHVTSKTFDYNQSLDLLLDELCWGWNGNWTESLEIACLELLISIDEDLVKLMDSWKAMMSMMAGFGSSSDSIEKLVHMVKGDISEALRSHSEYSLGRLHQNLLQFEEMKSLSMMLNIPEVFMNAIQSFMIAKVSASLSTNLATKIKELFSAGKEYYQQLQDISNNKICSNTFQDVRNILQSGCVNRLVSLLMSSEWQSDLFVNNTQHSNLLSISSTNSLPSDLPLNEILQHSNNVVAQLQSFSPQQILKLQSLKPQGFEVMGSFQMIWSPFSLQYLPTLSLSTIYNSSSLVEVACRWSETLLSDVVNIDTLTGYKLDSSSLINIATSANLIMCLLNGGFAYVVSDGKLLGLLPMLRSMLALHITPQPDNYCQNSQKNKLSFRLPFQLKKRFQEMPRIFRTKVKHPLSFKINSNFDLALSKLRSHHGVDCWVDSELEAIWRFMIVQEPAPQLLIFELWYNNDLIAADFGHPVNNGASVYIATRFYDRHQIDVKALMPGFLLALIECKYLQSQNCLLWDLGTSNQCPLMKYKLDLTGMPFIRPYAQYELNKAKHIHSSTKNNETTSSDTVLPTSVSSTLNYTGVVIENITISDLLNDVENV